MYLCEPSTLTFLKIFNLNFIEFNRKRRSLNQLLSAYTKLMSINSTKSLFQKNEFIRHEVL